ncbi:BatA and WFA domain-containing protein [Luteolibacter ambystomatis]|uniref:BatA and WFA domain-containing protein n=1 Tax=Luteolibacter ambystomatis TaxID=2824561 RepID=A0A975G644_9BACT|nr:BatA and WFA domain-containing protein [Luteolibacter ambystomatis]QUE49478.1 BatA and WFA domain-containing protein [Luteolibacter ambystomatis]
MLTLSNPYGLWALAGIPVILAIHFLQRKSVVLPVSTLFLLEKTQRESVSGRRFDRLMNSIPLWMQLLAVLLLAWFLCEPRYQKPRSTQRVAIVLDSSASMNVFKDKALEQLKAKLPSLQGPAAALDLIVFESTPGRPRLYAGDSPEKLLEALKDWRPRDGLIDPSQALRLARSLVSREGIVVYVTDTPAETLPFDARLLAVGEPIDNVGFTGISFTHEEGALVWRALVRNYGTGPVDRTWTLESPGGRSEAKPIHLDPNGLASLQGAFPPGTDKARLVLSADRFTTDDILPLVVPKPKPLSLFAGTSETFQDLTNKLLRSIEGMAPANDASESDLALISYDPLDPILPPGNAVVFVHDSTKGGAYLKGGIVPQPHPLMDGLNWQALLVRETITLQRTAADQVLLWQGDRPLIFLRDIAATAERPAARQLCFNFDLRLSNAATQPAFIVMLHRFAESIRDSKVAPASENLETNQSIRLASHPGAEGKPAAPLEATALDPDGKPAAVSRIKPGDPLQAPLDPGFFTVKQGDETLLEASVHYGDTREADFTACGAADTLNQGTGEAVERHTMEDPLWRIGLLVLIAVLLVSWHYTVGRSRSSAEPNLSHS